MPDIRTLQQVQEHEIHTMQQVQQGSIHLLGVQTAVINWDGEKYTGDYVVIPKTEEQVLLTKDKQMTDNVTVREVPYYETSNQNGLTAYIASNIDE